jgi:hypothetical protein
VVPAAFPKVQILPVLRGSLVAALMAVAAAAPAQAPTREVLNSERIAATFGSYGVEVLEQDDRLRISSLYSTDGGVRTCRTFAIVRYPSKVDSLVASEHAAIVAGGSIGATFAEHGWEVRKTHLHYGEIEASARLAELMRIAPGTPLAEHVYVLDVANGDELVEYAALVEIHHPEYLGPTDLVGIYGPADTSKRTALLADLVAIARERAR